MFLIIGS